jgi:protein ImuA
LTLGVAGIDAMLPGGGLARGGLHEVLGEVARGRHRGGAALAFTAVLAARRAALGKGDVLWCLAHQGLYGPGLAAFGLDAGRLILARGRDDKQRLWAMEEGLKCTGLAMVVGEISRLDLGQSRRLQLAAESSGVTALLLHTTGDVGGGQRGGEGGAEGKSHAGLGVSAALTRWRITPAPSAETRGYIGIGAARARAELLRCKGGRPGAWLLQWNGGGWDESHEQDSYEQGGREQDGHKQDGKRSQTHPLPVAAAMAHGPAVPRLAANT